MLSKLAESMIGSEIVRLGNDINMRIRQGETIYNYTIGDFNPTFFPIPEALQEGIVTAYREHYTNYPPADGILELRQAVSAFYKEREGLEYGPTEILIASGGRPLIYSLFKTVVDAGDKVIYAVPSWNNNHYTHLNNGQHCVIETSPEAAFMPTAENILPHIPGAALLCICTPQNPTGTTLGAEALAGICDLVLAENERRGSGEKKLYVMFDQMYWLLTYGNTEHVNPVTLRPEMKQYTIFVDGISKCFAATGVRVGWAFGPAAVIAKMKALISHVGAWAPMAEQHATAHFLGQRDVIDTYLHEHRTKLEERLVAIYNGLTALKEKGFPIDAIAPQAAIYLTVKFDLAGKRAGDHVLHTQEDVTAYLLSEAKLAMVPFYAFGASHQSPWYRISVGTCDQALIPQMLEKLGAALAQLQ